MNSIIQKIFSNYLFRVMATWFGVYIKDKIEASITEPLAEVDEKVAEAVAEVDEKVAEAVAEVDEKVAEAVAEVDEAMSHIPNGLTVMSESDWAETTPADQHIYMVFPDEQVTESES